MGCERIQELAEALAAFHRALEQDIDDFERVCPEELPYAAETRFKRMQREVAPALDALEALVSDQLYAEDWVAQIRLYADFREAVQIAIGDALRGAEYVRPAIEALGGRLEALEKLATDTPKPGGDEREKYAAALYVMAYRLADWADHKLPELSRTSNYCLSLELAVWSVGSLQEYCRWLEFIGHPAWADRVEREWDKLTDDALEADNEGDEQEEDTVASNLEDDAFHLSDRLASIALLLGAPSYDPYYHAIFGLCPTRRTGSVQPSKIPTGKRRRKRGRPKVSQREANRRRTILKEWGDARSAGLSRQEFCEDRNEKRPREKPLTVRELETIADWARQRRIRKNGTR